MAQRSHVPKFGNWDKDNVPYTAYFENARRDKASVRMNPNDPEENPEAFMCAKGGLESDGDCHPFQSPLQISSDKSISAEKHQIEGQMRHDAQRRNTFDHQKSGSHKTIPSDSESDKSNHDHSFLQPGYRRGKSDSRKGLAEGSNSFSPSVPGHSRQISGGYRSDDTHQRTASVPKFGAWDETDPKSGEGFTVIFNKVKEEKQIASTTFPVLVPQPSHYTVGQRKEESSSFVSKICCCCCCLFPRRSG